MRRLTAALLTAALAAAAFAQDKPPAPVDPAAAARAAHKELLKLRQQRDAEKDEKKREKLDPRVDAAFDKFGAEFGKLDWSVWDATADGVILTEGVSWGAWRAFDKKDYAASRKGWEYVLERLK